MKEAVSCAIRYVEVGIRTSRVLGKGSGPINHFHGNLGDAEGGGFGGSSLRVEGR